MDLSENARKILNKVYSWITESNLSNRSRIERQNRNLLMTLEVQRVFLKNKNQEYVQIPYQHVLCITMFIKLHYHRIYKLTEIFLRHFGAYFLKLNIAILQNKNIINVACVIPTR